MDGPEDGKAYLLLDANAFAAQMSGNSKAWLEMVRRKPDLLEERAADRGLYLLHAPTDGGVLRAALVCVWSSQDGSNMPLCDLQKGEYLALLCTCMYTYGNAVVCS